MLADQMEPCDRAVAARLVHLRPAMRLDARGDPPRDRQLEVDGGDLLLHAGAGLCWRASLTYQIAIAASAQAESVSPPLGAWTQSRETTPCKVVGRT